VHYGIIGPRFCNASELFSESVHVPPSTDLDALTAQSADLSLVYRHFHILLAGNPNLPTQSATDTHTDPFAVNGTSTITISNPYTFPTGAGGAWVGPGPIRVSGLTAVNFNGSAPIRAGNIPNQNIGNPPGQVQFGLVGPVDNTPLNLVGQHWGYEPVGQFAPNPFLRSVPVVSVTPSVVAPATPPPGQSFHYIVDYLQFTENGISGTEWVEFPYLTGQQPTFTYGGWADGQDPIHFTDVEMQLTDTLIPLDSLNFADDPLAGGGAGPAFVAAATPADVVPEPSGLMLLLIGVATLRRWR
jgi:hypothetical protein